MAKRDGRAVARENDLRVLRALHRFGWLRTRDLAVLVWQRWSKTPQDASPRLRPKEATASELRMAQRTLKRLRERRLVLWAKAPDGSTLYGLSEPGVRVLQGMGVEAKSGKDLVRSFSTSHFRHRCTANEIAIAAIVDGYRASTEREIAQALWLGGDAGIAGKRPDVLIQAFGRAWWIEVERARKNQADYKRLLAWLKTVRGASRHSSQRYSLSERVALERVVFVCTSAFEARMRRDLAALGWAADDVDFLISFETCLYNFKDINFGS